MKMPPSTQKLADQLVVPEDEAILFLERCIETKKERQPDYGDSIENFREMARIHNAMFGGDILPSQMCMVLIATKVSREKHRHKEDNIEDEINYWAIYNELLRRGI